MAWNPHFDSDLLVGRFSGTITRSFAAVMAASYGRTNGVVQVLVPLLGLGLEQPVACSSNLVTGAGSWACGGCGCRHLDSDAFRVGSTPSATGGPTVPLISIATTTLPQPVYPGFNNAFSSSPEALDPNFRPNAIDSFDLTIQRQLGRRMTLEVGYIWRRITHEYQPVELNPVPYMMTLGGQQFKQAYDNVLLQYCGGIAGLAGGGCGGTAGPIQVPLRTAVLRDRA